MSKKNGNEVNKSFLSKLVEQVKIKLSEETDEKLESAVLADGTKVVIEEEIVYTVTTNDEGEEVKEIAPEGSHELDNGDTLVVGEDGKLIEVKPKSKEGEGSGDGEGAEQLSKEEGQKILSQQAEIKAELSEITNLLTSISKIDLSKFEGSGEGEGDDSDEENDEKLGAFHTDKKPKRKSQSYENKGTLRESIDNYYENL